MFLLVSGRHVGAHPDGHQHGVSIQISINLGKNVFPHILRKKNCCDLNIGDSVCIGTFFLFPDSGLYPLDGFYFHFDMRLMKSPRAKPRVTEIPVRQERSLLFQPNCALALGGERKRKNSRSNSQRTWTVQFVCLAGVVSPFMFKLIDATFLGRP